jgi:hypothetical protein
LCKNCTGSIAFSNVQFLHIASAFHPLLNLQGFLASCPLQYAYSAYCFFDISVVAFYATTETMTGNSEIPNLLSSAANFELFGNSEQFD